MIPSQGPWTSRAGEAAWSEVFAYFTETTRFPDGVTFLLNGQYSIFDECGTAQKARWKPRCAMRTSGSSSMLRSKCWTPSRSITTPTGSATPVHANEARLPTHRGSDNRGTVNGGSGPRRSRSRRGEHGPPGQHAWRGAAVVGVAVEVRGRVGALGGAAAAAARTASSVAGWPTRACLDAAAPAAAWSPCWSARPGPRRWCRRRP